MSSSLEISTNYIKQKDAKDQLEAMTWAELQITIGGTNVTHVIDRLDSTVRSIINIPVFPMAQWIVENWWSILNEPCRTESVPTFRTTYRQLPWVKRHCVRSADSALVLPRLYFFNDGYGINAIWGADYNDPLPNMPAQFLTHGIEQLTVEETIDVFGKLVDEVLCRLDGVSDGRLVDLRNLWQIIKNADQEEIAFCKAVGRMGINPYDQDEVTPDLAAAICSLSDDPDIPLSRDLTEAASSKQFPDQLSWVRNTSREFNLHKIPEGLLDSVTIPHRDKHTKPHEYGFEAARYIRRKINLPGDACVDDIEEAAMDALDRPLHRESRNHLPGLEIRGIVGWSDDEGAILAGPNSDHEETNRFLLARGLFHALCSCKESERLVTQAYTWDQSASRSFAAEFLAPQAALLAKTGDHASWDEVEELARTYAVRPRVIQLQLENANVEVMT